MLVVMLVFAYELEVEQGIVVNKLEYAFLISFSNAIVFSDKATPFKFIEHFGQSTVVCEFSGLDDFVS